MEALNDTKINNRHISKPECCAQKICLFLSAAIVHKCTDNCNKTLFYDQLAEKEHTITIR